MAQGRRPEHDREQILEKGMQLFNKLGYHGTGLTAILKACRVSKGSFYNFFGSKEEFAVEMIEHYHSIECQRWDTEYAKLDYPQLEKMRIQLENEINKFESEDDNFGCLIANLSGELGNASPALKKAIRHSTAYVLESIEQDFKQCQLDGSVRNDLTPKQLAHLFWDSWQGALLRMKVDSSTAPLHELVNLYWNHILLPHKEK
ncbi:TetR/AcrR family transcriptional regulator [Neptunomonas sp.]|uniref:TetR/AcrR family transcriptional regulator n=1 Tax=Neptunomonas sp. TaxID=1971898 RepID=UPI003564B2A4